MKIKETINFTTLRAKGVNALDVKDDEVVKITTKNGIKCIVDEKYLQELINKADHPFTNLGQGLMGLANNTPIGNFIEKEVSDKFRAITNSVDEQFNSLRTDLEEQIKNFKDKKNDKENK